MDHQLLPTQHGFRRRFYTPQEVASHNSADDAWVSMFGRVLDLTTLIAQNRGSLAQPLILNAGRDISHWFGDMGDPKTHYDEQRGLFLPYTPMGRFLHVPPPDPDDREPPVAAPWWKDEGYVIGKLSRKVRPLRVVNTLTKQADVLHVCAEETIAEIQTRYFEFNAHASSYTWKQLCNDKFVVMDMAKTLEEAGIPDESEIFDDLAIHQDALTIPTVHVYFNDDLTEK